MLKPLAALAMVALCCPAQAYDFTFSARVTYTDGSLSGVQAGTVFSGSLSARNPIEAYPGFWRGYYEFQAGGLLTASIAGHSVAAGNPYAIVYDNRGGNVEDGFSVSAGYPVLLDGRTLSDGAFGFNLTTTPGNTGVIQGLDLPDDIDVSAFDGHSSLTYGYLQRDGGQKGAILRFQMLSITFPGATVSSAVPEPGQGALMALGLCGLGGLCALNGLRARRAAARLHPPRH
jgi:hypothetical protein